MNRRGRGFGKKKHTKPKFGSPMVGQFEQAKASMDELTNMYAALDQPSKPEAEEHSESQISGQSQNNHYYGYKSRKQY